MPESEVDLIVDALSSPPTSPAHDNSDVVSSLLDLGTADSFVSMDVSS